MRLLRGTLGLLVWILAALLSLVSVLLCVTVLLLPVGIPLLLLSKKMFGLGLRLITSRKVTHPIDELRKATAESMPAGRR